LINKIAKSRIIKTIYSVPSRKSMRIIKYVAILLLVGSINSCGLVKTIYNNAPEAVSWWLDDYFDFTQAQKSVLNPALHRLHDWHRTNQLPGYIAMLHDVQDLAVKQQISPTEACNSINSIKASFRELQLESIPIIVEIAPLLSDKQLQYFQTKLDKRAVKWKTEWMQESTEEQIEVRLEKIEDFAEKVYGNLNKSQHLMLKQSLTNSPIQPSITYTEILRRNEDAHKIVSALHNQSLSTENKSQLLKEGFERLHNSPNKTYQAYADQVNYRSCEIIADLHISTSAQQKQHAKDWLQNYIVQLSSLSLQ
jgi:hypothetical protein